MTNIDVDKLPLAAVVALAELTAARSYALAEEAGPEGEPVVGGAAAEAARAFAESSRAWSAIATVRLQLGDRIQIEKMAAGEQRRDGFIRDVSGTQ